ncbi:2-oxoacid:ferredoxin oxidoreductase subunit beta [Dehalobacterium formicoaceticum]|uniref:2-oxoacid:ferredoxin oxidoreductase subunit beta n=1 Tax=Dehalobacterium formicoaceticum TaxID=51515 RepID=A0ABT1Y0V6_9FIRM|nr:2-oxoacid:ferredoxin oxidoreductase subunit beta [Dehalobacterium formicoaceticum]MCR6544491.1 2-oxoacid:ferredoxin oxidoreductase subunit beta [Dehalobacterium formicoaceticum]
MALDIKTYDMIGDNAWCPGCGNFDILAVLKQTLADLELAPHEVLMVSGIGQAAKTPHYINANGFNGLHGRAVPPAVGAKLANKDLQVIISTGDGDTYGEGGNHLLHNIRRNVDLVHIVHDNQVYGLTKGQGSPTTSLGQITSMQLDGVKVNPLNPVSMALGLGCTFVARSFSGAREHLSGVLKEAIKHPGYALVDVLQNCVSFNKVNTYKWYQDHTYFIDPDHDRTDLQKAFKLAQEWEQGIPLGIFYKVERPTLIDRIPWLKEGKPLIDRAWTPQDAKRFLADFQ